MRKNGQNMRRTVFGKKLCYNGYKYKGDVFERRDYRFER